MIEIYCRINQSTALFVLTICLLIVYHLRLGRVFVIITNIVHLCYSRASWKL